MRRSAIPALNRIDITPVGVFQPQESLSPIFVLLRHRSLDSVATATQKLLADDRLTGACNRITPGVRPEWYLAANPPKDDQARTATPKVAMTNGATHLVIGRPIVQAADPSLALNQTLDELGVSL